MNKQTTRIALGALATLAVSLLSTAPSSAQSISVQGKYRAAKCGGASSGFVKSHGDDLNYDIGNTKLKSVLVNGGGGQEAGLEVLYTYSGDAKAFQTYLVNFKDDGEIRNDVQVHFCFIGENEKLHAFDKKLTDFKIQKTPTRDWSFGIVTAADFGFGENNKRRLVKTTFSLQQQGNIEIGNTKIGIPGSAGFTNNTVDVSEVRPCDVLNTCKDAR